MNLNLMVAQQGAVDVQRSLLAFDIQVPALDEVLATYAAMEGYTGPERPDLDAAALTLKAGDVRKLLDKATDAHLRRAAMQVVKTDLRDRLARRISRTLTAHADEITMALGEHFTAAAEAFSAAYAELPPGWDDAERLVAAGPDALVALQAAQAHLPTLDACRSIRRQLRHRDLTPEQQGTMFARVEFTRDAIAASEVTDAGSLGYWGNLLATDGVQGLHWWPTAAEHLAYAKSVPVFVQQYEPSTDGFRGMRKVSS